MVTKVNGSAGASSAELDALKETLGLGAGSFVFVGDSAGETSAAIPVGAQAGDVAIVTISCYAHAPNWAAPTITPLDSNTWTRIGYRILDGTETTLNCTTDRENTRIGVVVMRPIGATGAVTQITAKGSGVKHDNTVPGVGSAYVWMSGQNDNGNQAYNPTAPGTFTHSNATNDNNDTVIGWAVLEDAEAINLAVPAAQILNGRNNIGGISWMVTLQATPDPVYVTVPDLPHIYRSRPVHASARANTVLGALNNPWTQDVLVTAAHPTVEYEIAVSVECTGDELMFVALVCDGVIVDRMSVYTAGGGTRENRGILSGFHAPGAGAHTYAVHFASSSGNNVTVSSTVDVNPAAALDRNAVSSMKLTVGP